MPVVTGRRRGRREAPGDAPGRRSFGFRQRCIGSGLVYLHASRA